MKQNLPGYYNYKDKSDETNRKKKQIFLLAAYLFLIALPLIIAYSYNPLTEHLFLRELGKSLALAGFVILTLQFVIAARLQFVDQAFGWDRVMQFHRFMGGLALVMILFHPVALAAETNWGMLNVFEQSPPLLIGSITLFILLIHVIISGLRPKIKLNFQVWRALHDTLAIIILLGAFIHSWVVGSDVETYGGRSYWILLGLVALGMFVHLRIIKPARLTKHSHEVIDVIPEAQGVYTLKFDNHGKGQFPYYPGQFHFIRLVRNGKTDEEHHFTISSSPTHDYLSSTIKSLGDYTSTIADTGVGDKAIIHGPFGRFSYLLRPYKRNLVFLAGGIGITPLMSMIRYMRDTEHDHRVLLIYANESQNEIAFYNELEEIQNEKKFLTVVHVIHHPEDNWNGETGLITGELIKKHGQEYLNDADFYVCGPAPMIDKTIEGLDYLEVENKRVYAEIFALGEDYMPATRELNNVKKTAIAVSTIILLLVFLLTFARGMTSDNGDNNGEQSFIEWDSGVSAVMQ